MMKLSDLPEFKKDTIQMLTPSNNIRDMVRCLINHKIGAIPIVENDALVGICTERDIMTRALYKKLDFDTPIADIMTPDPDTVPGNTPVLDAVNLTINKHYRHILITDAMGKLASILSHRDVIAILWLELKIQEKMGKLNNIGDMLRNTGDKTIKALTGNHTARDATEMMTDKNIGSALIRDEDKLTGIVTERDLLRACYKDLPPKTKLSEIMTKNPDTATLNTPIAGVIENMVFSKYRHIPIVEKDNKQRLKDILSLRDFITVSCQQLQKP